jgi:hypothetical protein
MGKFTFKIHIPLRATTFPNFMTVLLYFINLLVDLFPSPSTPKAAHVGLTRPLSKTGMSPTVSRLPHTCAAARPVKKMVQEKNPASQPAHVRLA